MKYAKLVSTLLLLCFSTFVLAHWDQGEPYKMHFPQLPNPEGWDICLHDQMIADDFQCTESGPITDIHFWVSWQGDQPDWSATTFTVEIWSDAGGMPDMPLWTWSGGGSFVVRQPPYTGLQGWFCPSTNWSVWGDHINYWQINITQIPEPFIQEAGQVYWLVIQANKAQWPPAVGWTTSLDRWRQPSMWSTGTTMWTPVYILDYGNVDQAFVISGYSGPTEEFDLGDAPDSSNTFGVVMSAYPAMGVLANFPTVFAAGSPPYGPKHLQPLAVAWLGPAVSLENEADIGLDQDGVNNLNPPADMPDQDFVDDGVLNMPLVLPHCRLTQFQYTINVVNPAVGLYVNVWFDWNRDGDWDDIMTCQQNNAPEWAVQNQFFAAGSLPVGLNTVTTPTFYPWHPSGITEDMEIWMRITISEQPWAGGGIIGGGGSGPATGYDYGETEDYRFVPITECLKPTASEYADWAAWGKPDCWCCQRQCRGDADCLKQGPYWVGSWDLNLFRLAFNKTDAQLVLVPNGICADFNHSKQGPYRVGSFDLAIFRTWFNMINVPCCDLDGDCILTPADKYNFWTN